MNKLGCVLNSEQKIYLCEQLAKLHLFQGKRAADKEIAYFVDEISKWGYDYGSILKGIRLLYDANIKYLKLYEIRNAIKDSITVKPDYEEHEVDDKDWEGSRTIIEKLKKEHGGDWWKHFPKS